MNGRSRGMFEFATPRYPDIPADLESRMRFNIERGAEWYDNGVVNHYHDEVRGYGLGGKTEEEYFEMWRKIDAETAKHSTRPKRGFVPDWETIMAMPNGVEKEALKQFYLLQHRVDCEDSLLPLIQRYYREARRYTRDGLVTKHGFTSNWMYYDDRATEELLISRLTELLENEKECNICFGKEGYYWQIYIRRERIKSDWMAAFYDDDDEEIGEDSLF